MLSVDTSTTSTPFPLAPEEPAAPAERHRDPGDCIRRLTGISVTRCDESRGDKRTFAHAADKGVGIIASFFPSFQNIKLYPSELNSSGTRTCFVGNNISITGLRYLQGGVWDKAAVGNAEGRTPSHIRIKWNGWDGLTGAIPSLSLAQTPRLVQMAAFETSESDLVTGRKSTRNC